MQESHAKDPVQETKPLQLSVIIPTHNRADIVVMNLRSLARQLLPPDQFEVLVCDDASSDGTYERLQALKTPYELRLFRLPECGGPGKARNVLIREARAEALVILNDDAILGPAGLAMHAQALDITRGKNVAILGKFTFPDDYQRTPFGCLLEHTDLSFRFPLMESGSLYGASGFYSCNLGIFTSAVVEAGYFDEGYFGAGAEDMELGDRLERRGNVALYLDKCVAVHEHRLTIHDFCRSQIGRGGGGVVRCLNDFNMVYHYDEMDSQALARLRETLEEAEPAVVRLKDAVHALHEKREVALLAQPSTDIPWRNLPLRYSSHAQWFMPPRAIIREAEAATGEVLELMQLPVLGAADLGRLYQVCSFLKWRYDTVGISRSPWVDEFVAQKADRQASRLLNKEAEHQAPQPSDKEEES
ncbi:MAG: glycosyltransferase [Proteobacteria bacterium]|nr:glycosyltransferase [Pseudomonadota bacterium]